MFSVDRQDQLRVYFQFLGEKFEGFVYLMVSILGHCDLSLSFGRCLYIYKVCLIHVQHVSLVLSLITELDILNDDLLTSGDFQSFILAGLPLSRIKPFTILHHMHM